MLIDNQYFTISLTSIMVVSYGLSVLMSIFVSYKLFTWFKENKNKFKNTIFLILLAIQAIHIFWITDDIVYSTFIGGNIIEIPQYLAWFAILIDYLELPVIYDLLKRIIKNEQK